MPKVPPAGAYTELISPSTLTLTEAHGVANFVDMKTEPDFKRASSRAQALGLTLTDIAEGLGTSRASVAAARLAKNHPGNRPPPADWRAGLAILARKRARRLADFAGLVDSTGGGANG